MLYPSERMRWTWLSNPTGGVYVGRELRRALIEQIDAFEWETDRAGMARVRAALERAPAWRQGYRLSLDGLDDGDEGLLEKLTEFIQRETVATGRSRGVPPSGAPLMVELRRFRSAMGWD